MSDLFFRIVTNLGDSFALSVLVLFVAGWLYWRGWRRGALALAGALIGTAILISLEKLLVLGCGSALAAHGIRSPSGHASMSMAVYGTLAILATRRATQARRLVVYAAAGGLIGLIALSRVVLQAHTVGEVLVGLVTGLVALLAARLVVRPAPAGTDLRGVTAIVVGLALLVASQGIHLPVEEVIHAWAKLLGHTLACTA